MLFTRASTRSSACRWSSRRFRPAQTAILAGLTAFRIVAARAAVVSLLAGPVFAGSVKLAWQDNSNDEQGFKIERAVDGGSFTQIGAVSANITTYTDANVTAGRSYSYRVRAFNDAGHSGYSNAVAYSAPVINLPPTISTVANISIPVNTTSSPLAFNVGDSLTSATALVVTGTSSNQALIPNGNLTLGGSGNARTVVINPAPGKTGSATIVLQVSDGSLVASSSFTVTVVEAANTAPTISTLSNQTIAVGAHTGPLNFIIGDAETPAQDLTLTATSSQETVVLSDDIALAGSGTARVIAIAPSLQVPGVTTITVTVGDGVATTSTSFLLTITAPTSTGGGSGGSGGGGVGGGGGGGGGGSTSTLPEFVSQPQSQGHLLGGTALLSAAVNARPTPTYQWRKDGIAIPGATSLMLELADLRAEDAGMYDVVATNSAGSATSQPAFVAVSVPRYAGTYSGTFSGKGAWVLHVSDDHEAKYIAHLSHIGAALVLDLVILPDGSFSVTRTEVIELGVASEGTYRPSSRGSSPLATGVSLSGKIIAGWVQGAVPEIGLNFSGGLDQTSGPASTIAGFYSGAAVGGQGAIYASVRANGHTVAVLATPHGVDWIVNITSPEGILTGTTNLGATLDLQLDLATLGVTGEYRFDPSSAVITFASSPVSATSKLVNASIRTTAGANSSPLIAGFVLHGSDRKSVLMRAVGPGLTAFGVSGALGDPTLALFSGQTVTTSNDNWAGASNASAVSEAASRSGAFGLAHDSRDAALLSSLPPGAYSAHVGSKDGGTGITLLELYDTDLQNDSRLINISARSQVGAGESVLIVGFAIAGTGPRTILVRGMGPTLAGYGVVGALADPTLELYEGSTKIDANDDWSGSTALADAFAAAGAFQPANAASKDAALLVTLNPGVYSAVLSGAGGTTGVALLELYEMP